MNLFHIRWGDGTKESSVMEKCIWGLWEGGLQEEGSILCSRAGKKLAQWKISLDLCPGRDFWGSLKNRFQLGSGGRRRRQVPSYRSSKNIFELSHLFGGFPKDNYLYSLNLSIFPSHLHVSSLVMKEPGLIGVPGIKHSLVIHCSHILWKCQRRQESKGSSRVQFMSDSYQHTCFCTSIYSNALVILLLLMTFPGFIPSPSSLLHAPLISLLHKRDE